MKVKFLPQNVEYDIRPGQSVLELAQEKGVHIRTSCNGIPSCAECRIRVTEGDYNVMPPTTKELNLIGTGYFLDQRRLSCQLTCFGDVTIDTTEHVGKEGEGAVTKQFLQRVQKGTAEETHSVNGVLIEQDAELMNSVVVKEEPAPQQQQQRRQSHGQAPQRNDQRNNNQNNNQRRHHNNNNRRPNPNPNAQGSGGRNSPANAPRTSQPPANRGGRNGQGQP